MRTRSIAGLAALAALAALPLVLALARPSDRVDAHASCQSQYSYNADVFPVIRERCGSCHITNGAAPMTLLTYKDATQWASGMRDELTAERMPPWHVDPTSPAVKGGVGISGHEVDVLVTWAACNTPHGDLATVLPTLTYTPTWKLGPPDLTLQMPSAHTVGPDSREETIDVSVPTGLTDTKWVKAADLMPGATSMVRDAVVGVDGGPVLTLWEPGSDPVAAPSGTAFKLAAGATLHLQIHYKKSYLDESKTISDQSTIGLYFTDAPASGHELQALAVDPANGADAGGTRTFSATLAGAARIVALRPMLDQPYDIVSVNAVDASGRSTPLIALQNAWPQWFRRYWLEKPADLPSGTKVEVRVTPRAADPSEPTPPKRFPLEVGLDFVSQ